MSFRFICGLAATSILLGCAHRPPGGTSKDNLILPGYETLLFFLPQEGWIEAEKQAYNPAQASFFQNRSGSFLRVIAWEGQTKQQALEEMLHKQAVLKQLVERQVEPYFGKIPVELSCDSRQIAGAKVSDTMDGLRLSIAVSGNENFVYDCSSPSLPKYKSQLLLLYCDQEKKFYEIRFFYPYTEPWRAAAVAGCGH